MEEINQENKILEPEEIKSNLALYQNTSMLSNLSKKYLHKIEIAPMMEVTNIHYRFFMRLLTRRTTLWTEMYHSSTLIFNEKARKDCLSLNEFEHPVVCQLGGNDPEDLKTAAKFVEEAGFDEIDLNCGCPSPRVTSGSFGACLMKEPELVAECVKAMQEVVSIPVHVKCRIGVDDFDDYEFVKKYVETVRDVGCKRVIIHARKAFLKGLNPAQNRSIPPLKYDVVLKLAEEFPELDISINGGFKTPDQIEDILKEENGLTGCMIGRAAYQDPWIFSDFDKRFYHEENLNMSRKEVLEIWGEYCDGALKRNERLKWPLLIKPIIFLFKGEQKSNKYRRMLSDHKKQKEYDREDFSKFLADVVQEFEALNEEAMNSRPND